MASSDSVTGSSPSAQKQNGDDKFRVKALARGIDGVMVYDYDFANNGRIMAGYIGLAGTKDLRLLMASRKVQDIINPWITARKNGFGVLNRTGKYTWVIKQIWSAIEVVTKFHTNLLTKVLPISKDDLKVDAKNDLIGYASWAITAAQLLANVPGIAQDTKKIGIPVRGMFSCEDWFRAVAFMKHMYRSQTETRTVSKSSRQLDSLAEIPSFLTKADLGGMASDDQDTSLVAEMKKRADEILHDYDELKNSVEESGELDDELAFATIEKYISQVNACPDFGRLETTGRPALNKALVMHVATGLQARCRVRKSSEKMTSAKGADILQVQTNEDILAASGESKLSAEDGIAEEKKQFWELQESISVVSALAPPYDEACAIAKINRETKRDEQGRVEYQPWQAIGAAFLIDRHAKPMPHAILADDPGMGKTVTTLKALAELAANAVANHSADSDDVYLPTLVLCPSTLIDTWYSEWLQYFSSQLTLRQWYGSKHSIRDLSRQKVLIGARNEALLQYLDELEPRNPHTARVVILTSFSTWQQRSLKKNKAAEESDPGKGEEEAGAEEDNGAEEDTGVDINNEGKEEADLCDDYTSIFSGRFARIVCDEAHYIKNHQTRTAISVKKLQCRVSWLITATPMINKMADLYGYLHLIWDPDWEIKTDQPGDMYHPEFEANRVIQENQVTLATAVAAGQRPYVLQPEIFKSYSCRGTFEMKDARLLLPTILAQLQLRRTIATKIPIGNDKIIRPGDCIPHYRIKTIELEYRPAALEEYRTAYEEHALYLYKGGGSKISEDGVMNMARHRRLCHLTMDYSLERMFQRTTSTLVKDIQRWQEKDTDLGMTHHFKAIRGHPRFPVYQDRMTFAAFLCAESPKLEWLAGYCAEKAIQQNRRVVLMVQWPATGWKLVGFLSMLNFQVVELKSSYSASERRRVVELFNDPTSGVEILVANGRVASYGINLHHASHDLVIVDPPQNVSSILQMIGRVHRLGQKHVPEIIILSMWGSYDSIMEARQTKKMLPQLSGEGKAMTVEGAAKLLKKMLGQSTSRINWVQRAGDLDIGGSPVIEENGDIPDSAAPPVGDEANEGRAVPAKRKAEESSADDGSSDEVRRSKRLRDVFGA